VTETSMVCKALIKFVYNSLYILNITPIDSPRYAFICAQVDVTAIVCYLSRRNLASQWLVLWTNITSGPIRQCIHRVRFVKCCEFRY
jgi:hypothetical protein